MVETLRPTSSSPISEFNLAAIETGEWSLKIMGALVYAFFIVYLMLLCCHIKGSFCLLLRCLYSYWSEGSGTKLNIATKRDIIINKNNIPLILSNIS